jgi:hypothetical protein
MRIALVVTILLLLCEVGNCEESQPLTPTLREKTPHEKNRAEQSAQDGAHKQLGTENNPIVIKGFPAPESKDDADYKAYEQHEKPTLDRRMTVSTVLLAVFTFLLFCFTAALWWVTYRLSKESKNTSDRQAAEMERSFSISEKAVEAAQKSAEVAEKSLTMVERPYIIVSGISKFIYDHTRQEYSVTYDVTNHGRTPADIESIYAEISNDLKVGIPAPGHVSSDNGIYLSPILEAGGKIAGLKQPAPCNIIPFKHLGGSIEPILTSTDMIYFRVVVTYRSFLELDCVYQDSFFWVFDRNAMTFAPRRDKEYYYNKKSKI